MLETGRTILSLCDYTGNWARPYSENGYNVICVDLKHGKDVRMFEFAGKVYGVLAAPPLYLLCRKWGSILAGKRSGWQNVGRAGYCGRLSTNNHDVQPKILGIGKSCGSVTPMAWTAYFDISAVRLRRQLHQTHLLMGFVYASKKETCKTNQILFAGIMGSKVRREVGTNQRIKIGNANGICTGVL